MNFTETNNLIRTKQSRNRIVMPPMDTLMAMDGYVNNFHIQHYGARAIGGFGTIIVESTAVLENGVINTKDLGLWKDDHIKGLSDLSQIIKQGGAVAGIQLNHAGAKAGVEHLEKFGTTLKYYDYLNQAKLKLVTSKELKVIEDAFVKAAQRAKLAGFDFVELHAAHGYFLSNLIGKLTNEVIISENILERSDTLIKIICRIHDEVKIPIGIRMSFCDHCENGMQVQDYENLVKAISEMVEYFHVSSGETIASGGVGELIQKNGVLFRIPMAKQVKQWTSKNIIVVGNFRTRSDIELAMSNNLDAVAIGRETLFNPNLIWTNILTTEEFDETKYSWNSSPWFSPKKYKQTLDKIKNR